MKDLIWLVSYALAILAIIIVTMVMAPQNIHQKGFLNETQSTASAQRVEPATGN